ncbi:MAG: 16S rRNA processing protein RimM [Mariniphaga sp.]|nr:16S rRNA processing protein RimM [Mariniphaga sp.]
METIPIIECKKIGYLRKPHGVFGKMYLFFEDEFEESLEVARTLFVKIDGLLVPFFIENDELILKSAKQALVKFKWIETNEKAREYVGYEVYLKKENIIPIKKDSESNSLIGFQLYNSEKIDLGIIIELDDFSGNIVLTVDSNGGKILIPYNENLIEKYDTENKILQMKISEGLLNLE